MGSKLEVERRGKRGTFSKGIPDFHVFYCKKVCIFNANIYTDLQNYKSKWLTKIWEIVLTGAENKLMSQKFPFKCKSFAYEH